MYTVIIIAGLLMVFNDTEEPKVEQPRPEVEEIRIIPVPRPTGPSFN